uniref:Uncharacterized protein n=1 Tax=Zonotrichia albicollis TaxID=44394 RepID=A0A8D2NEH3_ZONAL
LRVVKSLFPFSLHSAATGNFDQDKFKYRCHSGTRLCYFLKFPPLMLISATSSVFHSCCASHSSFAGTLATGIL